MRPLVFVLGGSKPGKLSYFEFLSSWADYFLVGGKLPAEIAPDLKKKLDSKKVILGRLAGNGKDIDKKTIAEFKEFIGKGRSLVWAGPMGVYEEKENRRGTEEIAQAVAAAVAFKVAGGGDTHRVLSWFNLWNKFDFVSVGGGAMLQFLKDETLPGIKAVRKN